MEIPQHVQSRSNAVAHTPPFGLSRRAFDAVPLVATFVLFLLGTTAGGAIGDRDMLPLVRFLALVKLALGIGTCVFVNRYCTHSLTRWAVGQTAAVCMGLGAGLVWSASAFGIGFAAFMTGIVLATLLLAKELERRNRRRPVPGTTEARDDGTS